MNICRGSGGGRAEGRYLRLILPFAVSIPESTLMPFSVGGGGWGSRLSGPLEGLPGPRWVISQRVCPSVIFH